MKIVSMKIDPNSAEEKAEPQSMMEKPDYPYGLCVNIDEDGMEALGMSKLPKVGDVFQLAGLGKVVSVNQSADENSDRSSFSIQITDLGLEKSGKKISATLYDSGGE